MSSVKDIKDLAIKFKNNELSEKEFCDLVRGLFWKQDKVNDIPYGDHRLLSVKIPRNKMEEFCSQVLFMCWEDRCRGYGFLRSEFIYERAFELIKESKEE